jgi:rfaE bifunctional protein nucleotidyltransferase chain/domain
VSRNIFRSFRSKILSPSKAKAAVRRAQRAGREVVFTNGCFDILHPGHVTYLEAAKKKGEFLVVALDTDAAVQKLKGPSRPINPLESRLQVMAALESVDVVTWFDKGNPIPIIKALRPNILVKGGDWKVAQILGSKEVLGWGGKVYSLKYIEGKSTTNIVNKIRKS